MEGQGRQGSGKRRRASVPSDDRKDPCSVPCVVLPTRVGGTNGTPVCSDVTDHGSLAADSGLWQLTTAEFRRVYEGTTGKAAGALVGSNRKVRACCVCTTARLGLGLARGRAGQGQGRVGRGRARVWFGFGFGTWCAWWAATGSNMGKSWK